MKVKVFYVLILFFCFFFSLNQFSQETENPQKVEKQEKEAKVEKIIPEKNFFEAEGKFCETAKNNGIKEAFKNFGYKDAQIVQSSVISFREWFKGLEENRVMEFYPSQMVVSSSADFGFSVGSWKEGGEGKVLMWGNYMNVWKKVGSEWKIIIHSRMVLPPRISFKKEKSTEKIELSSERKPAQSAQKRESEMFAVLKDYGWAKIYNEYGDENIIRMRSDALTEKGKKLIFIKSVAERGYIEGKVKKSVSSKSKDLVLFLGEAKTGGPQISAKGSFIHIWLKDSEGNYKLYVDFFASERMQDRIRKKML